MVIQTWTIFLISSFLILGGSMIWLHMQDDHPNKILKSNTPRKWIFLFVHVVIGYGLFIAMFIVPVHIITL